MTDAALEERLFNGLPLGLRRATVRRDGLQKGTERWHYMCMIVAMLWSARDGDREHCRSMRPKIRAQRRKL